MTCFDTATAAVEEVAVGTENADMYQQTREHPSPKGNDAIDSSVIAVSTRGNSNQPITTGTTGATNGQQRFLAAVAAVCVAGMAIATLTALAFGKSGLYFSQSIFEVATFAAIDVAMTMNEAPQQQAGGGAETTVQPGAETTVQAIIIDRNTILKRVACWLAIGILHGTASALRYVSKQQTLEGTWQLEPIVYESVYSFCFIGLIGGVMFQAHKDRRPTAAVWCFLLFSFLWLESIGNCSPYPLLSVSGAVLHLLVAIPGSYFLLTHIDRKAEHQQLAKRGYKFMAGVGIHGFIYITLYLASFKDSLGVFGVSGILMLFHKACLAVCVPICERGFGDDEQKRWSFAMPAIVLALELGPCLLLLGEDITGWEFWALLIWQELNSVAKNTGKYNELYVAVCEKLGRPVGEAALKRNKERRAVIAPCDNIGEIASAAIIFVALGLESLFDRLPIERAPYLADASEGMLGAWRKRRFRGEAPLMMIFVLAVRLIFCWIEVTIRAHMRRREYDTDNNNTAIVGRDDVPRSGANARRSSMKVLYNRIVRSQEAPVELQYMAGGLFALQGGLFVVNAAAIGRTQQS